MWTSIISPAKENDVIIQPERYATIYRTIKLLLPKQQHIISTDVRSIEALDYPCDHA